MKSWQVAVALASLAAAGCRSDPNIALLERELRLQEDEIYRLRECIKDYQAALGARRKQTTTPSWAETADDGSGGLPKLFQPRGLPTPAEETGSLPREAAPGDGRDVAPPSPYGRPNGPGEGQRSPGPAGSEGPAPDGSEHQGGGPAPKAPTTDRLEAGVPADSQEVTQLVLHRGLTGGYDADGRPGDEGIVVVIEPRDAQGRWLQAPADVSVVALDPALDGEAARVARWDFTADETAARFHPTGLGRGLRLQMPWPADPPVHGRLYLFVRYTTGDGRRLQVEGPIRITPPARPAGDWVPVQPAGAPGGAGGPAATVRIPSSPSPAPAAAPAKPKLERPVWSPDRP